eukprot:scaffold62446_cov51-Phaeocystis_antarctica.AAC.3
MAHCALVATVVGRGKHAPRGRGETKSKSAAPRAEQGRRRCRTQGNTGRRGEPASSLLPKKRASPLALPGWSPGVSAELSCDGTRCSATPSRGRRLPGDGLVTDASLG